MTKLNGESLASAVYDRQLANASKRYRLALVRLILTSSQLVCLVVLCFSIPYELISRYAPFTLIALICWTIAELLNFSITRLERKLLRSEPEPPALA